MKGQTDMQVILTPEQRAQVKEMAEGVASMALYNGGKEDALDNAEFLAYEIIDLTEIKSGTELQRFVASKVLKAHSWPMGVAAQVSKYFDLML